MDGGSSLNIMYVETLLKMDLMETQLKHCNGEFYGVVPGRRANSLGIITLPVAFGDVNNFCEELITFEVVPFKSSYHVIFGRPTTTSSTPELVTSTTNGRCPDQTVSLPSMATPNRLKSAKKVKPP